MLGNLLKIAAVGVLGAANAVSSGLSGVYQVAKPVAELTGGLLEVGAKRATDVSKTVLKASADAASSMMK